MAYSALLLSLWLSKLTTLEPIHGTWITNVASEALRSERNIQAAVSLCKRKKVNTIFVVVWNKGRTMYPSDVLEKYIDVRQDPIYRGFDPIKCIVREGHRAGLKVHAWFEFGFSYNYGSTDSIWYERYPHWVAKTVDGKPVSKSGFYWWSAIHPKPRQLLRELILEVVAKYEVDGVQGDDRLPAMPTEGGYEPFTTELFRRETGADPPQNHKDSKWVQWRADKLSEFAKSLYQAVKKARPRCLVSWSPSIYPWSKEEYLQDWPLWLREGYADFVIPQVYRYDFAAYERTLLELKSQLAPEQQRRVFPGILTSLGGGYRIDPNLLKRKLALNKAQGFGGECLFYFETLREESFGGLQP